MIKQENDEYILKIESAASWKILGEIGFSQLDLSVKQEEAILITDGENKGAGQLYQVLSGQESLWEGSLSIHGKRRVIPTGPPVLPNLTAADLFVLPGMWENMSRSEAWKSSREWLIDSILWEKRSMPLSFLSGYERNLLMLLSTFSQKPGLVMLGNCMSEMSWSEQRRFWREVSKCMKRWQTALIAFGEDCRDAYPFDRCLEI